ncbi:bacteriocin fulvocin C-related protein [Avrilella dinanensis]|uniref:Uncharacterized protein n=1 Tax=Avrilella dinanensis TaxID=2008672 RepID=A0A2M9R7A4_9FLAO|nr:bacteriocin fulvocin C-related protein [Avrilella dinanensis]PJR04747.1 hypothetical protein CDL10_09485 [Avrilella dinanensis]
MNKVFYVMCGLLLTNFFISCSSEEDPQSIDETKVQYVRSSTNNQITKAAYQLLTSEEKRYIWADRVDYILRNEKLNNEQVSFLNELKQDMTASVFVDNSRENIEFKGKYNSDRLSIFEPYQGYYYFSSLGNMTVYGSWSSIASDKSKWNDNTIAIEHIGIFNGKDDDCMCNQGSMVNPGCDDPCDEDTETSTGCGFLFLWSCNGYDDPYL